MTDTPPTGITPPDPAEPPEPAVLDIDDKYLIDDLYDANGNPVRYIGLDPGIWD